MAEQHWRTQNLKRKKAQFWWKEEVGRRKVRCKAMWNEVQEYRFQKNKELGTKGCIPARWASMPAFWKDTMPVFKYLSAHIFGIFVSSRFSKDFQIIINLVISPRGNLRNLYFSYHSFQVWKHRSWEKEKLIRLLSHIIIWLKIMTENLQTMKRFRIQDITTAIAQSITAR